MEINAKMVSELREKTGAGMMKCKEALVQCKGDVEAAVDYLRKKGLASADGKSGRATSQGLVHPHLSADRRTAVLLEINCETDFVARNELFKDFIGQLSQHALNTPTIKTVEELDASTHNGQKVEETRKSLISKTGENITMGRLERIQIPTGKHGTFDTYVHGDGNIGVVVQLITSSQEIASNPEVVTLAHEIALQAAAMKPRYTDRTEVPAADIQREKEVILGQIKNDPKNANKPENILAKIVDGRIDKFYKEYCLVDQTYVKDDTKTIQDLCNELGKKLGGTITVGTFRRWVLGERPVATETPKAEACCACCG
ncbi:elongation factor Ts [Candidatus Ozemobacteraceae bacterium]|nr:elongation factor Ts [Candidatus Ozemobacteraceae bacterium]